MMSHVINPDVLVSYGRIYTTIGVVLSNTASVLRLKNINCKVPRLHAQHFSVDSFPTYSVVFSCILNVYKGYTEALNEKDSYSNGACNDMSI